MSNNSYTRNHRKNINEVALNGFKIGGNNPLALFAGPCVVEDKGLMIEIAKEAQRVCSNAGISYIFKASYDKANKTIAGSFRGPGVNSGLNDLRTVKEETGISIITDVHAPEQCPEAAEVADVLQIPALLSKQIDLIMAAAETGRPVAIKKGQFTAPWEMNNVISRLKEEGFDQVMVTERGYMFGYQTMISDLRGLQIMSTLGQPVIYDGSHSVHGNDTITSGTDLNHRDFIRPMVRSAVANGIDAVFLEIHPDPDKALSDVAGTLALNDLEACVKEFVAIDKAIAEVSN